MPEAEFKIVGAIKDFNQLDNLYKSLKREAEKLLDPWQLNVSVTFTESKGQVPQ